ncbi:TPA: hypothetical protein IV269_001626 [Enterococcus faecium]|uniref:Uncharacterized protein n=3 Tax=Enterococcus faecium TaxID=1352 RepID=A0A132P198_ENTFC|nr:hypothetical protein [Enterococcus faecium]EEW64251.1 hypothetical protein EFZG_02725 [Enterococcus faecium TC 6]EFD08686.1 hypothetical protein EDAG_02413 [Enterococcus faecium D344SRF]HAQ1349435.1 hypothetical protein [Enterococcus faecium Ef_RPH1]HAQ1366687.1 hypothetical protein [Enterococcus faecium Ef_RPH2]HAQ1380950.1 hypothetical protein [Enterococcus faecium Ef_aus0091]HAQ1383656.1 hypothetical protein [Enterococcus faecium Ef_aus0081]HAQ1390987.1 hypothetical protein [Enterococc
MAKATRKHIYLYDMHIEVLDEIISTHDDISNYSEAVRHLCMMYDPKTEEKISPSQIKLNAIGKEVSILTEMVSEFADLHLKDTGILIGTNSTVYQEAKERVEGKIKANQTKKYSPKIKKTISESVTTKSEVFDPTRFLKR